MRNDIRTERRGLRVAGGRNLVYRLRASSRAARPMQGTPLRPVFGLASGALGR